MWAGLLHLVLGNLLIGLLEGFLLAVCFDLPIKKATVLLILANYFSAWVGGVILPIRIAWSFSLDLYNTWHFFWAMVIFTYLMTLVLEFPFVALILRKEPNWLKKSIWGSLIIQTISYTLLFGWYWRASGTSLYTETEVVPLSALSLPEKVLLYFIASDDRDVYAMNLNATGKRKVSELNSTNRNDRLFVRPSSTDSNRWDLMARLDMEGREGRNPPKLSAIEKDFAAEAAPGWHGRHSASAEKSTWLTFGPIARLGSAENSPWVFWADFWPIGGLRGNQTNTGERAGFSFETPFGAWSVRNATHLPDDKVLFQLGENQICVFDPAEKRVALVAKGRGPTAVMQENRAPPVPEATPPRAGAQP
jgi:hypothetical protein